MRKKKYVGISKVTEEQSRIRSRIGTDPRIRIRIRTKMSRIRNDTGILPNQYDIFQITKTYKDILRSTLESGKIRPRFLEQYGTCKQTLKKLLYEHLRKHFLHFLPCLRPRISSLNPDPWSESASKCT
jgi:hypothetical protein